MSGQGIDVQAFAGIGWMNTGTARPAGPLVTHEAYLAGIRDAVLARVNGALAPGDRKRLALAKLVYGVGAMSGARGLTIYGTWQGSERADIIEVCAACEESDVQLAGTTVHELGHVLAGHGSGHGKAWKEACRVLGLVDAEAAGQAYRPDGFDPGLWRVLEALPLPTDGRPVLRGTVSGPVSAKPCPLGVGTRGGTSRGKGSGSRLRLYECQCPKPVKVRIASDDFSAHCDHCGAAFTRPEEA